MPLQTQDHRFNNLGEKVCVRFALHNIMLQPGDYPTKEIPGLKIALHPLDDKITVFDLNLIGREAAGQLLFSLRYKRKRYTGKTIEKIIENFRAIVAEALESPGQKISEFDIDRG
jgi:hypothetical protein